MFTFKQKRTRRYLTWYLFLTPALGLFAFLLIYPLGWSFYLSFCQSNIVKTTWIGPSRYVQIATNSIFLNALYNTIYMSVLAVSIELPLALILATLLNKVIHFRTAFRVMYFLPFLTSFIAAAIVWIYIFDPEIGFLNWCLRIFGLKGLKWINHPSTSKESVVIFDIWHQCGYQILILLAGLQTIPPQLYEAAEIDGANSWQKFFKITIPLNKPAIVFLVITGAIGNLKRVQEIYVFGSATGNPGRSIQTVVAYLYEQGWALQKFGVGSTAAWLLFSIIFVITIINIKLFIKKRDDG